MQLISVVGPTASGKTDLAIQTALEKARDESLDHVLLISADSRQVYREFPILSGVDHDKFTNLPAKIKFFGSEIISVGQDWSLGNFKTYFEQTLLKFKNQSVSVILVGGTMLYHKHLLEKNDQINVPPNENLRAAADNMTVTELQHWLERVDSEVLSSLNASDQKNPRRLIRHLEIAIAKHLQSFELKDHLSLQNDTIGNFEHSYLVPTFKKEDLLPKIRQRVKQRFQNGAIDEVATILRKFPGLENQPAELSKLPLGFKEITNYLLNNVNEETTLELWSLHEWQYAKRQLKWL